MKLLKRLWYAFSYFWRPYPYLNDDDDWRCTLSEAWMLAGLCVEAEG